MEISSEADLARAYNSMPVFKANGHPFSLLTDPAYERFFESARSGQVPNKTVLDRQFGNKFSTSEILWTLKQIAENN